VLPCSIHYLDSSIACATRADKYKFLGVVEGVFYNSEGSPTEVLKNAEAAHLRAQKKNQLLDEARKRYPNCSSRWTKETGAIVWCKDGKVPRVETEEAMLSHFGPGEVPIPRQATNPDGTPQKPRTRCACYSRHEADGLEGVTVYDGCSPDADKCSIKPKKKDT